MTRTSGTVGVICDAGHDVFSAVSDRLERRGYDVRFFEPGRRIPPGTIEELGLLANKKVDPESYRALRVAAERDVPTWNGYATAVLGARPFGVAALDAAGFETPETSFEEPDGDHVAKSLFDWHDEADPELNGEGAVYQRLLPAKPIDYKYYGVDDGDRVHVAALRSTSKLAGRKEYLDQVDPEPEVATSVRRLMCQTGAQGIGVDVVRSRRTYYAVDVNPAMSFRNADMELELADSMAARVGAPADAEAFRSGF